MRSNVKKKNPDLDGASATSPVEWPSEESWQNIMIFVKMKKWMI